MTDKPPRFRVMAAAPDFVPSTDILPPPAYEVIENAIIAPLGGNGLEPCGVFRSDGSFCAHSRTRLSRERFTDRPEFPDVHDIKTLEGCHLFGGLGRTHFGHFLLESLPRLWALAHVSGKVDGIVLIPQQGLSLFSTIADKYLPLYRALSGDLPFHLPENPVRVEKLIVPTQGFGNGAWITGSAEGRSYVRERLATAFTPAGPEKLYISRSRVTTGTLWIIDEDRIERLMKKAGYTVFHPQEHDIAVQCKRYLAAKHVVGFEGSAFHLAAFALQPGTRVALIKRRNSHAYVNTFCNQLRAFCGIDPAMIDSRAKRTGHTLRTPTKEIGIARTQFRHLTRQLSNAGFI